MGFEVESFTKGVRKARELAALPEAGDAAQSNDGAGFFSVVGPLQRSGELKRLVLLAGRAVEQSPKRWRFFLRAQARGRIVDGVIRAGSRQHGTVSADSARLHNARDQGEAAHGFTLARSIADRLGGMK
jgi:hypothetical protein